MFDGNLRTQVDRGLTPIGRSLVKTCLQLPLASFARFNSPMPIPTTLRPKLPRKTNIFTKRHVNIRRIN